MQQNWSFSHGRGALGTDARPTRQHAPARQILTLFRRFGQLPREIPICRRYQNERFMSSYLQYPPGFRARRGLNWGALGLLYTSYYMCRYNFSIANKSISQEFAFTRGDMGLIITTALF